MIKLNVGYVYFLWLKIHVFRHLKLDIASAITALDPSSAKPVFSYKLRYIVGFWLVEMVISTNQKPMIYRNLYENTDLKQMWLRHYKPIKICYCYISLTVSLTFVIMVQKWWWRIGRYRIWHHQICLQIDEQEMPLLCVLWLYGSLGRARQISL